MNINNYIQENKNLLVTRKSLTVGFWKTCINTSDNLKEYINKIDNDDYKNKILNIITGSCREIVCYNNVHFDRQSDLMLHTIYKYVMLGQQFYYQDKCISFNDISDTNLRKIDNIILPLLLIKKENVKPGNLSENIEYL